MSEPTTSLQARSAFVGRLLAGHFASYPLMFGASVFGMSLSIVFQKDALLAVHRDGALEASTGFQRWLMAKVGLSAVDAVSFEVIMRPMVVVLFVIFVVTHVASVPWALAARRAALDAEGGPDLLRRATRNFLLALGLTSGLVMIAGTIGWAIIFGS